MTKKLIYRIDKIHFQYLPVMPPRLTIIGEGMASTSGWTNAQLYPRFNAQVPPKDGIYEFDFIAVPPPGIALQVLTPIKAVYDFTPVPQLIKQIRVNALTNSETEQYVVPQVEKAAGSTHFEREAMGYSQNYSFDEAFKNALHNLPPVVSPHPDYLAIIKVEEIGAEIGGFAGLNRMFVRVSEVLK